MKLIYFIGYILVHSLNLVQILEYQQKTGEVLWGN